ncbi:hypothetical protein U2F26_06230 [Micromonospora sp. 4G57]|uniref:Metal transporter n=1 Tax=Micromonospora sicca TaxID=2202420 RepID=A0ABU5J973_9ACTN|nr:MULTISPECIES: hypothetical protein [unclassified Micromonospora]MDZ5442331.1 hypothetical protein [Micromonospora sp. 4G57]MDZ5489136.1 hypothetical protein [Micromonospora sp. 4G53]
MNTTHRTAMNAVLGLVFVTGLGLTAYLIADSWGGLNWLFDFVAGVVAGLLALLRGPQRTWPVAGGLAVAAVAIVVARVADLPQEPGPVTALALAVLVGSGIRTLPGPRAAAVAAGGFTVVVGTWLTALPDAAGFTVVTVVNTVTWLVAVALGIALRAAGRAS